MVFIVESSLVEVATKSKLPPLFLVELITLSPTDLNTGILSPVILDSSIEDSPLIISPSNQIVSKGLTLII